METIQKWKNGVMTRFIGRNGYFKCVGLIKQIYSGVVKLIPITSKGIQGHCLIELPYEEWQELIAINVDLIPQEMLSRELSKRGNCVITWGVEDVRHTARENGYDVSEETAQNILSEMERRHDAEHGICWVTIDCYLGDLDEADKLPILGK